MLFIWFCFSLLHIYYYLIVFTVFSSSFIWMWNFSTSVVLQCHVPLASLLVDIVYLFWIKLSLNTSYCLKEFWLKNRKEKPSLLLPTKPRVFLYFLNACEIALPGGLSLHIYHPLLHMVEVFYSFCDLSPVSLLILQLLSPLLLSSW